jgi:aerobic-type carbon monoxide dehydrogenase small subunit (CoxS/CutS family)
MTGLWVLRNSEALTEFSLRELMAGNLCRCTGYDGIIDGLQAWVDAAGAEKGEGQ